jgi:hypothetical protein
MLGVITGLALGAAVLAVGYGLGALLGVSQPLTVVVVAFVTGVAWGGFQIRRDRRQPRRVVRRSGRSP